MTNQELVTTAERILKISLVTIGKRHAYRAEETDEWYWVTISDMRYAVSLSKSADPEIKRNLYSHGCAATGTRVATRTAQQLDSEY